MSSREVMVVLFVVDGQPPHAIVDDDMMICYRLRSHASSLNRSVFPCFIINHMPACQLNLTDNVALP